MSGPEPRALRAELLSDQQLIVTVEHLADRLNRVAGALEAALEELERRGLGSGVVLTQAAEAYLLDRYLDRQSAGHLATSEAP